MSERKNDSFLCPGDYLKVDVVKINSAGAVVHVAGNLSDPHAVSELLCALVRCLCLKIPGFQEVLDED